MGLKTAISGCVLLTEKCKLSKKSMNREKTSWGINIYMWKQTAMVYCYLLLNEKPPWNLLAQTRMSFLLVLLGSLTGLYPLVAQLWLRYYGSLTCLLLGLAVAWISLSLSLLLFSSEARASPRGSRSILRDWRQKLRGLLSPRLWNFQNLTSATFCSSK